MAAERDDVLERIVQARRQFLIGRWTGDGRQRRGWDRRLDSARRQDFADSFDKQRRRQRL